MATPPRLSSSLTFLNEWVIPALVLLGWGWQIQEAMRISMPLAKWIMIIIWGIAFILALIYSWPIKLVTVEGDYFVISNYFIKRRVPIAHLAKVGEGAILSRRPTIILYFEPPAPFGKRVRIITPWLSKSSDDEIAAFLRSLISNRERP
jgi:hypothetical protein